MEVELVLFLSFLLPPVVRASDSLLSPKGVNYEGGLLKKSVVLCFQGLNEFGFAFFFLL